MNVVDVDYNSLFGVYLEVHKRKQQSIYIFFARVSASFHLRFISNLCAWLRTLRSGLGWSCIVISLASTDTKGTLLLI